MAGKSILEVAKSLGMPLEKQGMDYIWTEHPSFSISPSKNIFSWFSKDIHGGARKLVETIQGVTPKEASNYLRTGNFEDFILVEKPKEPFKYTLQGVEAQVPNFSRKYLVGERGLSEETFYDFWRAGLIAEPTLKTEDYTEPVIAFKSFDQESHLIGVSMQGTIKISEQALQALSDKSRRFYGHKGYLKKTAYGSDGQAGLSIKIGEPKRLVFCEAPIDMMSYYELHKPDLHDVRLVAMDGLKQATVSRYAADLMTEGKYSQIRSPTEISKFLGTLSSSTTYLSEHPDLITLAVDNDEAGLNFIEKFKKANIPVVEDIPELHTGQIKNDWNDELKIRRKEENEMDKIPETKEELLEQFIQKGITAKHSDYEGDAARLINETIDMYGRLPNLTTVNKEQKPIKTESDLLDEFVRIAIEANYPSHGDDAEQLIAETILKYNRLSGVTEQKEEKKMEEQVKNEETQMDNQVIQDPKVEKQETTAKQPSKHALEIKETNDYLANRKNELFENFDSLKEYFETASRFPDKTPNNVLLIQKGNPKATFVATFDEFKKLGGFPKKGQHGFKLYKKTDYGVQLVPVFDISQTTLKNRSDNFINEMARNLKTNDTDIFQSNISKLFSALKNTSALTVSFDENLKMSSLYNADENQLILKKGMNPKESLSAFVDEIVNQQSQENSEHANSFESLVKQAASYTVKKQLGLDPGLNTSITLEAFPVAGNAENMIAEFYDALKAIQVRSNMLLKRVDTELSKTMFKSESIAPKNPLEEKIQEMKTEDLSEEQVAEQQHQEAVKK